MQTLIVEDDSASRALLSKVLVDRGHNVAPYDNAELALESFSRSNYSLVITDWMLAGEMDGIEFCRRIRAQERGRRCLVIVITSKRTSEDLDAVLEAGADDYLPKPVRVASLKRRIRVAEQRIRDLHRRLEMEEAVRRGEVKLRRIFENVRDVFYETDMEGSFTEISPAIEALTGYRREDLLGKPVNILQSPVQMTAQEIVDYTVSHGGLDDQLVKVRGADDRKIYFSINANLIREKGKRPRGIVGTLRDVTDRVKAQRAANRFKRRLELLLECAGEGICGLDPEGNLTFLNPAARALLKRDEDVRGLHLSDVMAPPDECKKSGKTCFDCITASMTNGGNVCSLSNAFFKQSDESTFPVDLTCTPLEENGERRGSVIVFRDISEKLQLQSEKDHLLQQLVVSEKTLALGKVAAGIAHDINNPAAAVQNDLKTLLAWAERLPECRPKEKIITIAMRDVNAISRVTERIQAMKSSHRPGGWHEVDVHDEIEQQLVLLQQDYKGRVEIERRFAPLKPVRAYGSEIGQVLMNLFTNAFDAIEGEGLLVIETEDIGPRVAIHITDSGKGVPEDVAPRIFELFYTTKEVGKGTGIGLYAVKDMVEKQGGTIALTRTEAGVGSTFTIELSKEGPQDGSLQGSDRRRRPARSRIPA